MSGKMTYVRLGKSGLKVSRIILGCGSYGDTSWASWVLGEEEGIEHIKYAWEHGITTFDTADFYSHGKSEIILGKAIKELNLPRDELVIMTKLYMPIAKPPNTSVPPNPEDAGIINQRGLSRKHIFDSIKASLSRLQLDYVDLYQCHRFDYDTPIEETMQALHDIVKAGYVRYIGMSSCYAYQFHQMQNYAITHNLTPFISMQNQYSLLYREEEREMFPTLKLFGVGATPWSPLARGLLARPADKDTTARTKTDQNVTKHLKSDATPLIRSRVQEIATRKGTSMAQVSLAWMLSKPGVSAPIVGSTSLTNLEDLLGGLDVTLTEEEVRYLEEEYRPLPINGHS